MDINAYHEYCIYLIKLMLTHISLIIDFAVEFVESNITLRIRNENNYKRTQIGKISNQKNIMFQEIILLWLNDRGQIF